ncbi:conserved unknown protein [Ectocarpus siliculosus]|uniref:Vesicle transport protein n=1 Tax=Ectocarpus siliculosus TaxID=2880 RepID=D8LTR2_ECTSI|nr:conserved unknown protein [Ectocarpus siliculosus]|eukprot:CBN73959.1 conserved unknown protein [Ectocarpus siliculosus]
MFQGVNGFGGGGSKASSGFGQWYLDMQDAKEEETGDVEDGSAPGWRFWQANEKKTDGQAAQALLPGFLRNEAAAPDTDAVIMGMSYQQRFKGFVVSLLLSVAFFVLAFVIGLPMIMLRPHKFALTFTLGSFFFMGSFAMLKGPVAHLKSMLARDRLPFTVAYVGSMGATLYACLILQSYMMVVTCSVIQLLALAWYFLSFVPGGSQGMRYFLSAIHKTARYTLLPCIEGCRKTLCFCLSRGGS